MSRRTMVSVRHSIEVMAADLLAHPDRLVELSAALDFLEMSDALSTLLDLMPSRRLMELAQRVVPFIGTCEETIAYNQKNAIVSQCLWNRIPNTTNLDATEGEGGELEDVLANASRATYQAAQSSHDRATWVRLVREQARVLGPVLVDCAQEFASTRVPRVDQVAPSTDILQSVVRRFARSSGAVEVLDLFTPIAWLEDRVKITELPRSFGEDQFRSRASKLSLQYESDHLIQAGTYEFGRSGEPRWFVRHHGTVRDVAAQVHEQGHAYLALLVADGAIKHANLMPTEAGECVAYAAELLLARDTGDPHIHLEVLRMAAQNAFSALFTRHLATELVKDEPGALPRAWCEAALSVGLASSAPDHEWLLTSISAVVNGLNEQHATGHVAALGAIEELGITDIAGATINAFEQRCLREVLLGWIDSASKISELKVETEMSTEAVAGITLPSKAELAARIPHMDDAVAVFLSGSLVAGLGHGNSDVDVYVVQDALLEVKLPTDSQIDPLSGARVLAFYIGERRWDVEYVTAQEIHSLIERLYSHTSDIPLSHGEQDLIYRCLVGSPVKNSSWLNGVVESIRESNVFDAVVEKHQGLADGMLDDALGMLAVNDVPSAAFCARLGFEHMVDAWLARTKRICPSSKWRDRQLSQQHAGPVDVALYRRVMQMEGYDESPGWVLQSIDLTRELGLDL